MQSLLKMIAVILIVITAVVTVGFGSLRAEGAVAAPSPSPSHSEEEKPRSAMSLAQAVVLGMVEGLTEYLPVSSTGHLLLAQRAMGIGGDETAETGDAARRARNAADAYAICIQAGAIVAVLGLYRKRVSQMLMGILGKDQGGVRLAVNVAGGFMPAAVIGLMLNGLIKQHLFGLWPVVVAWLAGGVAILWAARRQARSHVTLQEGMALERLNLRMALAIGFAQCIAMWPGVSRSLVTIVSGVMTGLSLSASVEFSFLLGVVTLGAATAYDAMKHGREMLQIFDWPSLSAGLVSAFIFAVLSIKWMVSYLSRHGMAVFGYYRVVLAVVVGALIVMKVLQG